MLFSWIKSSSSHLQSCNSLTSWQSWLIEPQSLGDSISQILINSQFLGLIAHEERYAWSLIIPHIIIGPSRGRIICHHIQTPKPRFYSSVRRDFKHGFMFPFPRFPWNPFCIQSLSQDNWTLSIKNEIPSSKSKRRWREEEFHYYQSIKYNRAPSLNEREFSYS